LNKKRDTRNCRHKKKRHGRTQLEGSYLQGLKRSKAFWHLNLRIPHSKTVQKVYWLFKSVEFRYLNQTCNGLKLYCLESSIHSCGDIPDHQTKDGNFLIGKAKDLFCKKLFERDYKNVFYKTDIKNCLHMQKAKPYAL
jgi:hypothetical protein